MIKKVIKQKNVSIFHVVQQFLNAKNNKKEFARTAAGKIDTIINRKSFP